jgi:hypothetical protein
MAETSLVGRKARLVASQGAGKTSPVARQVSTPRITNTATTRQGLDIANIPSLPVSATGANPVLTVGGSGSTPAERLYPVTNDASPTSNALNYSLSGSGFGLDKFGQKVVEKDLTGCCRGRSTLARPPRWSGTRWEQRCCSIRCSRWVRAIIRCSRRSLWMPRIFRGGWLPRDRLISCSRPLNRFTMQIETVLLLTLTQSIGLMETG